MRHSSEEPGPTKATMTVDAYSDEQVFKLLVRGGWLYWLRILRKMITILKMDDSDDLYILDSLLLKLFTFARKN